MVSLQAAVMAIALAGTGQTGMLDFYADWCAPCKAMNPTVDALIAKGYPVQRVNIDRDKALAAKYRVQSIPCFVMVVDGREVDRVVGGTTSYKLEQMCKLGTAPPLQNRTPAMLVSNPQPGAPPAPSASAVFDGWGNQTASQAVAPTATVSDAALLAASVRLRVEDPGGHSCGSGTIIDARSGKALVLTCGHIFRDSQGKGRIEVDLFGPNGQQRVVGQMYSFDLTRDLGLVIIDAPGPVATARVAPPGYRIQPGAPVVSVGCNHGDQPTAIRSQVTSLDKFQGPPNLQVTGQPVEGRSGGGLFSSEGYVIGVCNAADPSDQEGLFAALASIHAELDRKDASGQNLSFVYTSPGGSPAAAAIGMPNANAPAAIAVNPVPSMPKQMPGSGDPAMLVSAPMQASQPAAAMPSHEQAALDEIRRSQREGAEVVVIIRPRGKPDAKSEVFMLDHVSRQFVGQLSAETRGPNKPYETSLDLPSPRKVLLEWSANGTAKR